MHRAVFAFVILATVLTSLYTGLSFYTATQLVYVSPTPLYSTPAAFGLSFRDISFQSREDHVEIKGWFIPGVLPGGKLTANRTIIMVHGTRTNRADKAAGLLPLSVALARRGFAILAFDMRGMGESAPAPLSLGSYESRDVLGAVDFLRSGELPYPQLGRPRIIGGWGVSMGAATLLLAAAEEPDIKAIVSDSAYADILPILEREIPKRSPLPAFFTPGALVAADALYGINYYDIRPVDVVARIAPRPIFFIQGDKDTYVPTTNIFILANAARKAPNAHVQMWYVPGAGHAQSYNTHKAEYVSRVVAFFNETLGISGLLILLPVVLAIVFPQSPAP